MKAHPTAGWEALARPRFSGAVAQPLLPHQRYVMPSVTDTFSYGKAGKTTVQSLIGGGQIFGKVGEILDNAKKSVLIDLYNFQSPALYPEKFSPKGTPGANIQGQLVEKLVALKKSKPELDIKIIIDNHWDTDLNEGYNDRTIAYLRKNGIDIVTYPDFSKISHVKVLMVDNEFAVVGGMNWGNHSPTNRDAAIFIKGPDVRNVYNTVFKPDWISSGRDAKEIPKLSPFPQGKIKILQTAAKESHTGPKDEIFHEILNQIANAKESIHAELFVLTQKEIVDSLIAAHKRLTAAGKEGVKILVDPGLFFAFKYCRPGIQKLARAGVPIQFFQTNREAEEKLHAKYAVFDSKRVLLGSANWSGAGLLSNGDGTPKERKVSKPNHEIALLIESETLGKTFADQIRYDWEHQGFPIMELIDDRWKPVRPDPTPSSAGQNPFKTARLA